MQQEWLHREQLKRLKSKKDDERQIQQEWLHLEQLKRLKSNKEDEQMQQEWLPPGNSPGG